MLSDTSELCRCIRPKNGLGRRLERVGRRHAGGPAVDRLGNREIINTVSARSSAHTGAAVLEYRLIFPPSTDDTSLEGPVQVRRSPGDGFN